MGTIDMEQEYQDAGQRFVLTADKKCGKVTEGKCFKSSGSIVSKGKELKYNVDAQDYLFMDDNGEAEASMFVISQFLECEDSSKRPVLFVFNGGPGMTMADMYVTMYGPKVLDMKDYDFSIPYKIKDNDNWILDACDIVLIDPVGCGYGQLLKKEAAEKFYGMETDSYALSKFIAFWLKKYGRFNSHKYLNGVSYGGVRCAILPSFLNGGALHSSRHLLGISVNGVISMSDCNMFDFANLDVTLLGEPIQVTILPTCAATNYYHNPEGKGELNDFINEAEAWGKEIFKPFLLDIENASDEKKQEMAAKLAYYTGMPAEAILAMEFNYEGYAYVNTVLAGEGKSAGYYNSKYTMAAGGITTTTFDPIYDDAYVSKYWPVTTMAAQQLYQDELGVMFDDNREFLTQNFEANEAWDFHLSADVRVHDWAIANMRHNENMRTLCVAGKYDFSYPIACARYFVNESGMPKDRTSYLELESGHEPYYEDSCKDELSDAIREFVSK